MPPEKKILIVGEERFAKVCDALLQLIGYRSDRLSHFGDIESRLGENDYGLVITSHPYGSSLLESVGGSDLPVLVLSDVINFDLLAHLEKLKNAYCMLRPVDFQKLKGLVLDLMSGNVNDHGGYKIV